MKKLISILRHPFRVNYRLTVLYEGDTKFRNTYSSNVRLLRKMAHHTEEIALFWSIYKSGPFGLPEHEIDSYMKGDKS